MKPIATTLASALALCLSGLLPLHAADLVPLNLFTVPEGLEVKLWAAAPLLHNPTSIDTDKDGRLWVTEGVDYGPDITAYARMQPSEVVLRAMIEPSADIAHGFEGSATVTKDGKHIHGMTLSSGDPLIIRSQGGMTQMVPAAQIQSTKPLGRSLMLSAEQLGLGAQEIADVLAYLKSL